MPRRNVFPYPSTAQDYYANGQERHQVPLPDRPNLDPATELQALMEAASGESPAVSLEERLPLVHAIQRCVEQLSDVDKCMIEGKFYEGLGYRGIATKCGLSRMDANRRLPMVVERLKALLASDPLIKSRLGLVQEIE